jgi:hypothetical protein
VVQPPTKREVAMNLPIGILAIALLCGGFAGMQWLLIISGLLLLVAIAAERWNIVWLFVGLLILAACLIVADIFVWS